MSRSAVCGNLLFALPPPPLEMGLRCSPGLRLCPPAHSPPPLAARRDLALLMQLPAALCLARSGSDTSSAGKGPVSLQLFPYFFPSSVTPTARGGENSAPSILFYPWAPLEALKYHATCCRAQGFYSLGQLNECSLLCALGQNEPC